ncbi:MAG: hypothetical protein ABFC84_04060 [Veillonellales bacterium]
MVVDDKDSKKMIQLAREGKGIKEVWEEDFSNYDYWDVYWTIKNGGVTAAREIKKQITMKLNQITSESTERQKELIDEIQELIWQLYSSHKENRKKLEDIRKVIG